MDTERVIERITAAKKYRDVCPDAVRRVVTECAGRYKNEKSLEKAVRERLHGVSGAYAALEGISLPETLDDEALTKLLERHASTRERLPLARMDALYAKLFAVTGTPESLLDLACGLNPLYLKARYPSTRIVGVDLSRSCAELTGGVCADLFSESAVPEERFDVALLFKILPLMERERAGAGEALMRRVYAKALVASFPTRSLGGRNVGMAKHYDEWMRAHTAGRTIIDSVETENEVYYVLQ